MIFTIASQKSADISLIHCEKSSSRWWDTILSKSFSSFVREFTISGMLYWQSLIISSFQLFIPNNFKIVLKSLSRFAFQVVTKWLDQTQFSENIGFGTTKIGLCWRYAKSAVIRLPDHSRASGRKSASDNHAINLFLCGKLHAVGWKSNLNSDNINHQFWMICCINERAELFR